jgi:hypothetical protein
MHEYNNSESRFHDELDRKLRVMVIKKSELFSSRRECRDEPRSGTDGSQYKDDVLSVQRSMIEGQSK